MVDGYCACYEWWLLVALIFFDSWCLMLLRCWDTSSLSSSSAIEWPTRHCLALLDFLQLVWPWHNISLCFCKYSFHCSVLGVASGYGFGFICGIQLVRADQIGPAALAIFLCLGESHLSYPGLLLLILKTSVSQDWASMTCLPWSPPCRTSPSLRWCCLARKKLA